MISKSELKYVTKASGYAPYPGDEYASHVMTELKEANELFKEKYDGKSYSMILSNGEEFEFAILNKNLCHMLGINAKALTSEYAYDTVLKVLGLDNSLKIPTYEFLTRIIERSDDVLENERKENSFKLINFYKMMVKIAIFKQLTNFQSFDYGVINFNRDTFIRNVGEYNIGSSDKYIFMPSGEVFIPYFMVGLIKNNGGEDYVPETLVAPENFVDYFKSQEFVLPVQLLIDDNKDFTKLIATPQEKLKLLNRYKEIISTYNTNSKINIYNDYIATLTEQASGKNRSLTL